MSSGRLVPAVPSCILDPLREEFLALLPPHIDDHPLGCHRRRIPDSVVFDKLVEVLARIFHVHDHLGRRRGSDPGCA
jgi:hypothetical protein